MMQCICEKLQHYLTIIIGWGFTIGSGFINSIENHTQIYMFLIGVCNLIMGFYFKKKENKK